MRKKIPAPRVPAAAWGWGWSIPGQSLAVSPAGIRAASPRLERGWSTECPGGASPGTARGWISPGAASRGMRRSPCEGSCTTHPAGHRGERVCPAPAASGLFGSLSWQDFSSEGQNRCGVWRWQLREGCGAGEEHPARSLLPESRRVNARAPRAEPVAATPSPRLYIKALQNSQPVSAAAGRKMGFDFCTSRCLSLLSRDLPGSARPWMSPGHPSTALSPRATTPRARNAALGAKHGQKFISGRPGQARVEEAEEEPLRETRKGHSAEDGGHVQNQLAAATWKHVPVPILIPVPIPRVAHRDIRAAHPVGTLPRGQRQHPPRAAAAEPGRRHAVSACPPPQGPQPAPCSFPHPSPTAQSPGSSPSDPQFQPCPRIPGAQPLRAARG